MTNFHRRTLLKSSIPALAGAIATGAVAREMIADETPIQRLYREWEELGNRYGGLIDENNALDAGLIANSDPDRYGLVEDHYKEHVEPVSVEFYALESRMLEIPAQDIKDLAIKGRIMSRENGLVDAEFHVLFREDADRILGYVNI